MYILKLFFYLFMLLKTALKLNYAILKGYAFYSHFRLKWAAYKLSSMLLREENMTTGKHNCLYFLAHHITVVKPRTT